LSAVAELLLRLIYYNSEAVQRINSYDRNNCNTSIENQLFHTSSPHLLFSQNRPIAASTESVTEAVLRHLAEIRVAAKSCLSAVPELLLKLTSCTDFNHSIDRMTT
jgi:hypothetical protein